MRIFGALLLLILTCLFQTLASAKKITIAIDYSALAPGDTFQVTFSIDGSRDDYRRFIVPRWNRLRQVGGPYESKKSSIRTINGKTISSQTVSILYRLQAAREGSFTIGPAQIEDTQGNIMYSDSLIVTVKKGQKKIHWIKPGQDQPQNSLPQFEDLDYVDDYEYRNQSALAIPYLRIANAHKPYLLITGWAYLPKHYVSKAENLLNEVALSLNQRSDVYPVDSLWNHDMPRIYYVLDDTTGIRAPLESILSKGEPEMKSTVVLTPVTAWNTFKETNAFDYENLTWTTIFKLTKHKEFPDLTARYPTGDFEIKLSFGSREQKEAFSAKAATMGYKFNAADTTSDMIRPHRFKGGYLVTIPLNEPAIYRTIKTLITEAEKAEFSAVYFGYHLEPLEKKKEKNKKKSGQK